MKMNVAMQCMIVLVCMGLCSSATIKGCQCVKTSKSVQLSLIADVKVYDPRPYCSRKEVIAVLKDKSSRCLDPKEKFTQAVLKTIQIQRALRAGKMKTTSPRPATTLATM